MKILLAKLKIIKDIAVGYFALYSYFTIFLIYFNISLPFYITVLLFILCIIITIVDWLWIFPTQQKIIWERNVAYQKLTIKKE